MSSKNVFLFRESGSVLAPEAGAGVSPAVAASVAAKFQKYGFIPSAELMEAISASSVDALTVWLEEVEEAIKERVDGGDSSVPFYVNFPNQVLEASDGELYYNAIMHYLGDMVGYRILPEYKVEARNERFFDFPDCTVVSLGSDEDVYRLFQGMLTSVAGWNEARRSAFISLVSSTDFKFRAIAAETTVVSRENNAHAAAAVIASGDDSLDELRSALLGSASTATDALRIASALSGFSPALLPRKQEKVIFKSFPGRVRRELLSIIDSDDAAVFNVHSRVGLFKRLGEKLHPGQYASRFPSAAASFTAARDNKTVARLSAYEAAYAAGDVATAVKSLYPGEYIRQISALLSISKTEADYGMVIDGIKMSAPHVGTRVLWQAYSYFKGVQQAAVNLKEGDDMLRATLPKGDAAMFFLRSGKVPAPAVVVKNVCAALLEAIMAQYGSRESLKGKKFFIDDNLQGIRVPNNLRDITAVGPIVGRGSRIALPGLMTGEAASKVRLFMHWSDIKGGYYSSRVDLDLSAVAYKDGFVDQQAVWYGDLRNSWAVHSGDITSAPNGAAEYIDVDIAAAKADKIRYVVLNVTSYTGQPLADIPEAYAGAMVIPADAQKGDVFDMRSVVSKFQLTSPKRSVSTLVFDVETMEIIVADMALSRVNTGGHNVLSLAQQSCAAVKALSIYTGVSVYDVLSTAVEARGGEIAYTPGDDVTTVQYAREGVSIPMGDILSDWL